MQFGHIITTVFCLLTTLVYSKPIASSYGRTFQIRDEIDHFVENELDNYEVGLYYDLMDLLTDQDILSKRADSNNQGEYYDSITMVIESLNSSGLLWTLLDALADHPDRIDFVGNLTEQFLKGRNITINVGDLLAGDGNSVMQENVNLTAIIDAVQQSGLVTSLLDGILLDKDFRPALVNLINRVVMSQKDVLYYIFDVVLSSKRDSLAEDDILEILKRADNSYSGTLETFLTNAAATVLGSTQFGQFAGSLLNALNDTGFAVYVVQRFISTESYINMTATLIDDVMNSGAIHIDFSSLNITLLVSEALADPTKITLLIGGLLSGDSSTLVSTFGKYSSAVQQILVDLEAKGLFANLNSYIFGDPSATTSITLAPGASSAANTNVGSITLTATGTITPKLSSTATSSTTSAAAKGTSKDQEKSAKAASGAGAGLGAVSKSTLKMILSTQALFVAGLFFI